MGETNVIDYNIRLQNGQELLEIKKNKSAKDSSK